MAGDPPKPRGWSYKPGAPDVRGYDTPALFREDCLEQIRSLANQIAEHQRKIEKLESELPEREKRIRRLKKELGVIDLMEAVKVKLTWNAFSEIRRKHPNRVLVDMYAGLVLFTDNSVTLHVPVPALGKTADTQLH